MRLLYSYREKPRVDDEAVLESIAAKELLDRLPGAIEELPLDLREVFVLCVLEKQPGKVVAKMLSIPKGTVWRKLHQARKQLRLAIYGVQDEG